MADEDAVRVASSSSPVSEARLEAMVLLLDKVPQYLRAISLVARAMFSGSVPKARVPAFEHLQAALAREAAVLRFFLVPVTVEVTLQMQQLMDHYILKACDVWQRSIHDCAATAKENGALFRCLADFYGELNADLDKYPAAVQDVREALMPETMKFQREAGVLSIRSRIKDDVSVALLFVPEVDVYAAPLVHGGERKDFLKPAVAKSPHEVAFATAMAVTDSLLPAAQKVGGILRELESFCGELLADLLALGAVPTALEDLGAAALKARRGGVHEAEEGSLEELTAEERAALEARQQLHYETVRPKAYWLERSVQRLKAVAGNISSDLESAPEEEKDYAFEWLASRRNSAGQDIVDVARTSTMNAEILDALDPD